ncbi:MAG: hypothetical protein JXJ17_11935 [Anaerolineae bacterium]|nr:hypothetical protein [Anaerolineae bacterium]
MMILKDGQVYIWGFNGRGTLLDNGTQSGEMITSPQPITSVADVVSVAGGVSHQMVLKNDGTVWSWGYMEYGQGGLGEDFVSASVSSPQQVNGLADVAYVDINWWTSGVVRSDGSVWLWGEILPRESSVQSAQEMGITRARYMEGIVFSPEPYQVPDLCNVKSISIGYDHILVLKHDGTVWAWGDNDYGKVGVPGQEVYLAPVEVTGLPPIKQISAGATFSTALAEDGTVWVWGNYYYSYNSFEPIIVLDIEKPNQMQGLDNVISIATGYVQTLALTQDGTVMAWGGNGWGQLGDGTTHNRSEPFEIEGLSNIIAIAASYSYSMALEADGTLWTWGDREGWSGGTISTERLRPVQVIWPEE